MSRLKTVPGRLSAPAQRLGAAVGDARAQDKARSDLKPWRKWYGLKRWKDLRLEVLRDAGWVCQQTGVPLIGKHPAPDSPAVDHIIEHHGNAALFWSRENLQAVSKEWHDREKQRLERRGAR